MTTRPPASKDETVVIVGAGVFGLSTALELKKRGYGRVVVMDRFIPPVLDGSSVDISRIIRTDYADPLYGKMASEALELWNGEYSDYYYQPGFVRLCNKANNPYVQKSLDVSRAAGIHIDEFADANDLRRLYPNVPSRLDGLEAYLNQTSGWANAAGAIGHLSRQCSLAGVSFVLGARGTVRSLLVRGGRVVGVKTAEGDPITASQVILATGAWTGNFLPIHHATSASGQPVGFIQLTADEAKRLDKIPVIMNVDTGMFIFPPSPGTHILKIAHHGFGFATRVQVGEGAAARTISSPKSDGDNVRASFLPDDADAALREGLRQLIPEFAERPWMNRRLCWYSDTPLGDFVVDHHPKMEGLFIATGGSGHGFKFLPVLGRYIADCYENKAPQDLRVKWQLPDPDSGKSFTMDGDGSRQGQPLRTLSRQEQAKL